MTVELLDLPAWLDLGACRGSDNMIFFPDRGGSSLEAKQICATCKVKTECRDYAVDNNWTYGVWGGTSVRDRKRMRREL